MPLYRRNERKTNERRETIVCVLCAVFDFENAFSSFFQRLAQKKKGNEARGIRGYGLLYVYEQAWTPRRTKEQALPG